MRDERREHRVLMRATQARPRAWFSQAMRLHTLAFHIALVALLGACPEPRSQTQPSAVDASPAPTDAAAPADAASLEDATEDAAAPEPAIGADEAEKALFLSAAGTADSPASACAKGDSDPGRIRCMIGRRYPGDSEARSLALDLYRDTGDVAGVEREQTFDGGFRGTIHIVPEPPMGAHKKHLEWVASGMRDFDDLFGKARASRPSATLAYRWRALTFHFFRSVGRTTPSAYASGWRVAYNVSGSLLGSAGGARETLFHEIFHLNDSAHSDWSTRALRTTFDAIVKKCGSANMACLAPYAPSDTVVRGGTYYAFQPDNGDAVREYAAELALRWYKEHRAVQRGEKFPKAPFKCGPAENAKAWGLIVSEFWGGIDQTSACP
jgi:hypothetical protein